MIAPHITLTGLGYLFLGWLAFAVVIAIVFLLQEKHRYGQHREFYGRADHPAHRQRVPRGRGRATDGSDDVVESQAADSGFVPREAGSGFHPHGVRGQD